MNLFVFTGEFPIWAIIYKVNAEVYGIFIVVGVVDESPSSIASGKIHSSKNFVIL